MNKNLAIGLLLGFIVIELIIGFTLCYNVSMIREDVQNTCELLGVE